MTFSIAAAAQVRLIVWRKGCDHQVEPERGLRGAAPVLDWRERLVCFPAAAAGRSNWW
jgi:hypothetical protein